MARVVFFVYSLCCSVLSFSTFANDQLAQTELSWLQSNLSPEQISWLKKHPTLKLGIDRSFSPYEWIDENGRYTGIAADYMRLLEGRLEISLIPVTNMTSWGDVLSAAKAGEFDLMSCLVKTTEREEYLHFTESYLSSAAVIISEQGRGYVGTLDKLEGMRVAIHKGHFTNELLRRDYPEITIISPPTIQEALRMVAEGEADAFVGDATAASFVMKQEGILNLSFSGHSDYQSEFRIGVMRDNPELTAIISKALDSITDSERAEIYDRWSGLEMRQGVPVEKILMGAAVAILLLLSFIYWNYRLRTSEEAHRQSEKRFKNLVDTTDAVVWEADVVTNRFTYISENVVRIWGYPVHDWLQPGFWALGIHPEDREEAIAFCNVRTLKLQDHEFDYRFVTASGNIVWIRDMVSIVADQGKPVLLRGLMLDITDQKKAEMLVRKSEHRFRELIESLPAISVQGYSKELEVIYWNEASTTLYGFSRDEAMGKSLFDLIIPPQMQEEVLKLHSAWVEGGQEIPASELELLHKDGSLVPVYSSHVLLISDDNNKEMYCIDISLVEQKKAHAELSYLAHFDPLTLLPNRRTCSDRLSQMMKRANRDGKQVAVMMIDLDHFKEINDTLGHAYGDLLLQEATNRLAECVRETDTVARLGGDEFLVILESVSEISAIERIARNILQHMGEPFMLNDIRSYVSASIGITLYPSDASTKDSLLKNADQAMYAAKEAGRNRFNYFTPEMEQFAQKRRQMLNELRDAIELMQLEVYYQPIIDLSSGEMLKAEALLRWNHSNGQISPADFIPLAEETGLIVEIGNWVFAEVTRQLAVWNEDFDLDLQISVNTSSVQYQDEHYCKPEWFASLLERGLRPGNLCIEITESLLMEPDKSVLNKLLMLRDHGIEVSLDDFGTGYSSLAYLKEFDIDYLKIDKSFVCNLKPDNHDQVLCEAIIVMAHTLGIKVIAEGIETEQQQQLLQDMGCDFGQGYLYSRPKPAQEFTAQWLPSRCPLS